MEAENESRPARLPEPGPNSVKESAESAEMAREPVLLWCLDHALDAFDSLMWRFTGFVRGVKEGRYACSAQPAYREVSG